MSRSGSDRPLTAISSSVITSGAALAVETRRRRRRRRSTKRSMTSAIVLVSDQATSSFWPKTIPSRPGNEAPRQRSPADLDRELVGDPRHPRREVRIAGEQRGAGGRAPGPDGPVVGAGGLGREAERLAQDADLLGEPEPVAAPRDTRLERDRVALRIAGIESRRELGAELARQVGADQLALPVRRETEREQLGQGQACPRAARARSRCAGAGTRSAAPRQPRPPR